MIDTTNFTDRARRAINEFKAMTTDLVTAVEQGLRSHDESADLDEAIKGLRMLPGWIRSDARQELGDRAIDKAARDPIEEVARSNTRAALRQLSGEDRAAALASAVEEGDLATIRAVLTGPAWGSGLDTESWQAFREHAHSALIQPVNDDHAAAQAVLSGVDDLIRMSEEDLSAAQQAAGHKKALAGFQQRLGIVP